LAQFQQILDGRVEVVRFQRAVVELGRVLIFKQLDVELQPAHARKVVFARIEKHAVKQRRRSIQCRRITWPQLAVDLDQRFLRRIYRVTLQGLADDRANVVPLGEEQAQLDNARIQNLREFLVPNDKAIDRVERLQDVFARTQSECAQENRSQELAFAIDANVKHVLLVVFKFHPRTAIGNDLAQEVSAVIGSLEEHTRRAVQLADNYALGSIHNEGAVVGHQRHVAEKDFLLFNIANGTIARFRILL